MAPYFIGDIASFIRELAGPSTTIPGPFNEVLGPLSRLLIFLANLAGGVVIGVAALRALGQYLVVLVRMRGDTMPDEAIRLSLGRSLSLALEFQLAADILGTALNPTLRNITTLAAIAALRTRPELLSRSRVARRAAAHGNAAKRNYSRQARHTYHTSQLH